MNKKGFTLIELLVVIAIIAILAAVIFPVYARAREKARQTSCLSNLKQVDVALLMYADDYDETYPASIYFSLDGSSPALVYAPWRWAINPYVKNDQVFRCASRSRKDVASLSQVDSDYCLNGYFAAGLAMAFMFGSQSNVTPTSMVCFSERADKNAFNSPTEYYESLMYYPWKEDSFFPHICTERHNGGSNYAFADGHVKLYPRNNDPDRHVLY